MNVKLNKHPINWVNGMAFKADHLSSEFIAVLDRIRDAAALSLNDYNYGLLGAANQKNFATSFHATISDEQVKISLCRALTKDGSRIEILDQKWEELSANIADLTDQVDLNKAREWFLLLAIDPYIRIPEGEEDVSEKFRRKPFTRPAYQLELISIKEIKLDNLANVLPLAKFEVAPNGSLRVIADYIPPCARLDSHERLLRKYDDFDTALSEIRRYTEELIKKIKAKKRQNSLTTTAIDINNLCLEYQEFYISNYDEFKLLHLDRTPKECLLFFAKLARLLHHSLETATDKNHTVKYIQNWCMDDKSEAQILKDFTNVFEHNYVHYDLGISIRIITTFLESLKIIFKTLQDLDFKDLVEGRVVTGTNYTRPQTNSEERKAKQSGGASRIQIRRTGSDRGLGDDLED